MSMSEVTIAALVERVNELSALAGKPPLSIAEPLPTTETWTDGMSEPDTHGAVKLQFVEETLRPALKEHLDRINAGKKPSDPSYMNLPARYFVRQAIDTYAHQLDDHQINTILLNTGQHARSGTYVGRVYPVEADHLGREGNPLSTEYAMTYGPTADEAGREIEVRYWDVIHSAIVAKPGDPDFEGRNR